MRSRRRMLAGLAMVVLIGAGCASTPAENGSAGPGPGGSDGDATAATREQAMKFSACMRDNGVKEFPDPPASGQLTIDGIVNGSSLDPNAPAFKQAISACKDLQPPGFTGYKRTAEQQEAALKFAQCVRENGVQDFPDPAPDAPLIDTNRIPSAGMPGGMATLNATLKQCRGAATAAGVTGSR